MAWKLALRYWNRIDMRFMVYSSSDRLTTYIETIATEEVAGSI
jgi:hypothetical protein